MPLNPSSIKISDWQEAIEKQPVAGRLFYSLEKSRIWLTAITAQLKRSDPLLFCGKNRNQTKVLYLKNVFDKYFLGKVQPYLAKIDGLYLDLQPSLRMISRNASSPESFETYKMAYFEGQSYQAFKSSAKAHAEYWQSLLTRCNIKIGR